MEPNKGDEWPVGRACHAACCLGYGSDNPSLFVIGGGTTDDRILQDAWIFNVASRVWREVIIINFAATFFTSSLYPLTVDSTTR